MKEFDLSISPRFKPSPIGSKQDGSEGGGTLSGSGAAAQDPVQTQTQQHQQFLGDASMALPDFAELKFGGISLPEGVTHDDVKTFQNLYREHCEVVETLVIIGLTPSGEIRDTCICGYWTKFPIHKVWWLIEAAKIGDKFKPLCAEVVQSITAQFCLQLDIVS